MVPKSLQGKYIYICFTYSFVYLFLFNYFLVSVLCVLEEFVSVNYLFQAVSLCFDHQRYIMKEWQKSRMLPYILYVLKNIPWLFCCRKSVSTIK